MPYINDHLIKKLNPPESGNICIWDDKITGFGVRITSKNAISFILRYVIDGRERRYTIGKQSVLSVTAARDMAKNLLSDIYKKVDPMDLREKIYKTPTLAEFFEIYKTEYSVKTKRKSTIRDNDYGFKNHIKDVIGNYKLTAIKRSDLIKIHGNMVDRPYSANRTIQLLSSIFNYAIEKGYLDNNPAKGITPYPEERRDRWLSTDEMEKFFRILSLAENKNGADIIRLLLLTGARKMEVLSMRWDNLNLDKMLWTKPASTTKQNKIHTVSLNELALDILSRRWKNRISDEYVFYNKDTGEHIKEIKRFWQKLMKTIELKNFKLHDLRHTFASHLASNGLPLNIIGELLGHSSTQTTKRYAHLSNSSLNSATNKFSDIVKNATNNNFKKNDIPKRQTI